LLQKDLGTSDVPTSFWLVFNAKKHLAHPMCQPLFGLFFTPTRPWHIGCAGLRLACCLIFG
jgi:hypothetical protein